MLTINLLAVLGAGLASVILGYLWYGPIFGKQWMAYMGINPMNIEEAKKGMAKNYAIQFLASLVMAYVLGYFISLLGVSEAIGALILTGWFWLGFFVTTGIGSVLWEKRPWGYYFINAGYSLVSMYVMSLILAYWV